MSLGRIEAYLYSSGTADWLDATQSLQIVEATGPVSVTVTLPAPARFSDALSTFETLLNASALNNTYAVTWDAAAQAVSITRTAGTSTWTPTAHGALWRAFGWASHTPGSQTTGYTGTVQSRARFDGIRVGVAPVRSGDRVDFARYRHGRAEALSFGNHDLHEATIYLPAAIGAVASESYCVAGRVRLWQDQTLVPAWSYGFPAGYLDGYVLAVSEVETMAVSEQWIRLRILLGVPR